MYKYLSIIKKSREGGDPMEELYQTLYFHLFNQITDALQAIDAQNYGTAKDILIRAQQDAEEQYLSAPET